MGILDRLFGDHTLPELGVDEVAARLGQPDFHVFDNNGPRSYEKVHVPGAKRLDPGAFTEADLPADKNATLVFYCSGPG